MSDKSKIIAGLAIFVVIVTFPFWYNLGKEIQSPILEISKKAKSSKYCVLPNDNMVTEHMLLLDEWRYNVVRNSKRLHIGTDGKHYEMSLTNTCLDCHNNKSNFCDKCHNYVSVSPYCWDCHIDNSEGE